MSSDSARLTNLRIGIPHVRLLLSHLSDSHNLPRPPFWMAGVLSSFARQFHCISLPPCGSCAQEPRCDCAPRFPSQHPLRTQRVLHHCQRGGEQQSRALRWRSIWFARSLTTGCYCPVTGGGILAFADRRFWRGSQKTYFVGHLCSHCRVRASHNTFPPPPSRVIHSF